MDKDQIQAFVQEYYQVRQRIEKILGEQARLTGGELITLIDFQLGGEKIYVKARWNHRGDFWGESDIPLSWLWEWEQVMPVLMEERRKSLEPKVLPKKKYATQKV